MKVSNLTIVHNGLELMAFDVLINGELTRGYVNWRERSVTVHWRRGTRVLALADYENMTGDMCAFIEQQLASETG